MKNRARMSTFDTDPTAALSFLTQQAAYIESEVYRQQYPQYKYTQLVPLDNSAPDWTQVVGFRSVNSRGEMKLFGPKSTDVPTVEIAATMGYHEIQTGALGYEYSIEELGYAQLNGINIDNERAIAVRDGVEKGMNQIYLQGGLISTANGKTKTVGEGLYTGANVSQSSLGTNIVALVAAGDAQAVLNIFSNAYNQVFITNTSTVHMPTDFVMPASIYQLLQRTLINTGNASNFTFLMFLQANFPNMTFDWDILLEKAGKSGTTRLVTYKKDIRILKGHDVMPLRFLAPATADNVNFKVPAICRTGGVEWRVPKAAAYFDNL
ncbi:major capsid family protein [Pseudomonas sp. dw_358]|uniref:major capsid family protein n=1 Tax=Pseudomonas sp. dw_358 TaxID=2720083 RepID=UPI001BD59FAE|nr:major capsid family protein [Pseudomonas sp. dw_358]